MKKKHLDRVNYNIERTNIDSVIFQIYLLQSSNNTFETLHKWYHTHCGRFIISFYFCYNSFAAYCVDPKWNVRWQLRSVSLHNWTAMVIATFQHLYI